MVMTLKFQFKGSLGYTGAVGMGQVAVLSPVVKGDIVLSINIQKNNSSLLK